jgi:hypothetical protein
MSKQEARDFRERWKFVNAFIADEIRNTSPDVKLQQLRTVFDLSLFRQNEKSKQVEEVRARWIQLKSKPNG